MQGRATGETDPVRGTEIAAQLGREDPDTVAVGVDDHFHELGGPEAVLDVDILAGETFQPHDNIGGEVTGANDVAIEKARLFDPVLARPVKAEVVVGILQGPGRVQGGTVKVIDKIGDLGLGGECGTAQDRAESEAESGKRGAGCIHGQLLVTE